MIETWRYQKYMDFDNNYQVEGQFEYVNFNVSYLTNRNSKEGIEVTIFKHRLSFLAYLGKYDEIIDLQNNMIKFGSK